MILYKNKQKYDELRATYQTFSFDVFRYQIDDVNLKIVYHFSMDGKYTFHPEINIPLNEQFHPKGLPIELIENLIFNIGMVELISYWKAACPPKVIIKPYKLTDAQMHWWKKLYFNGLGEFFYLNDIDARPDDFMEMVCMGQKTLQPCDFDTDQSYMVPIGGGKDSVVTLELLKSRAKVIPMVINPRKATDQCIAAASFSLSDTIIVHRSLDKQLLQLNQQGFLNGHTPFSALLAFTTLLTATLGRIGNIALSNEASANETTVVGSNVNHQYSKSYEFESDFRYYVATYITTSVNYFSFLRPLYEIQIAKLFARYRQYHPVFKSCNAGSKTDVWCCNCPKCLFAYIILSPYLSREELLHIFGEDLLDKCSLQHAFDQLIGDKDVKPFECIGTIEEVNIALCETVRQYGDNLPRLLKHYKKSNAYTFFKEMGLSVFKNPVETEHFLSADEMNLLKENLYAE